MKNFDWDRFLTGDVVVHCGTEEDACDFLGTVHKLGFKWDDGKSLKNNPRLDYDEDTCYQTSEEEAKRIWVRYVQYYQNTGRTIVKWEIDNVKEFTKEDLKVGMLVKTKYYDKFGYGMIMPSRRLGLAIAHKNEKWESIDFPDIAEVWGYCNYAHETLNFDIRDRELLYERKEGPKKMTVKEICELVGFDVEIVKG